MTDNLERLRTELANVKLSAQLRLDRLVEANNQLEEARTKVTRLQEALAAAEAERDAFKKDCDDWSTDAANLAGKCSQLEARVAALADTLDCAKTDWEGCNGEIISDSDPHWTVEARALLALQENSNG